MTEIYSKWHCCDFHVHTPASYYHNYKLTQDEKEQGIELWDKYISELEQIKNIDIIGICDYYSLEGYRKVLEYKKRGRLPNFKLIVPNIEFRLSIAIGNKGKHKKLNFHVIFDPQLELETIEGQFLNVLECNSHNDKFTLTKHKIKEIGRDLQKFQPEFQEKSDYAVGCEQIYVDFNEIIETLMKKSKDFKNKFFLILENQYWELLGWKSQTHLLRKTLFTQSHLLFTSNYNNQEWAAGLKNDAFEEEFGSIKSCIHGSDSHSFENLCIPDGNRFTWVKSLCTFEGLRQMTLEPLERVIIQESCPEFNKNIYTPINISSKYGKINDELEILPFNFDLSDNFIAVIGGRGSGKTAFLDMIAVGFNNIQEFQDDSNSFLKRIEKDNPKLEIELKLIEGNLKKAIFEPKYVDELDVVYLRQGSIDKFTRKTSILNEKIVDVLNSVTTEEMDRIKTEISEIEVLRKKAYQNYLDNLGELTKIQKIESTEEESLAKKKNENIGILKNIDKNLNDFVKKFSEEKKEEIKKISISIDNNNKEIEKIEILLEKLSQIAPYKKVIENLNDLITSLTNNNNFKPPISTLDFSLINDQIIRNQKRLELEKTLLDQNNKKNRIQINKHEDETNKYSSLLKNKTEIIKSNNLIQKSIEKIHQKQSQIEVYVENMQKAYSQEINYIIKYINKCQDQINEFSKNSNESLENISFEAKLKFDKVKYNNNFRNIFLKKSVSDNEIKSCEIHFEDMINEIQILSDNETDDKHRYEIIKQYFFKVKELIKNEDVFKSKKTQSHFYQTIFDRYLILEIIVFYNGIELSNLSMGQKGTVLLKIILAQGDSPILIDQPEENLDNLFIYKDLVKALREAKKKRQIIIATHNANLVVNTDADQIIVADYTDKKISFRSGPLEELITRNKIIDLLEGGEKAFQKREKKYLF